MLENEVYPHLRHLNEDGCIIVNGLIDSELLGYLNADLGTALENCSEIQRRNGVGKQADGHATAHGGDGSLVGAAHHVVTQGRSFLRLLEQRPCFDLISKYLNGKFILNSFGSVTNVKSSRMYEHGRTIHRDTRSFHKGFCQTMWMLVMLDDFTPENGATWILKKSQYLEDKPEDSYFYKHAIRALGKAGSVAIYDGRVWHAAGENQTEFPRRALTISFSLPFIKPQLDYVRFFGEEKVKEMSDTLQQLLGYHSRIPVTLEDWYQKPELRFYKSDQG